MNIESVASKVDAWLGELRPDGLLGADGVVQFWEGSAEVFVSTQSFGPHAVVHVYAYTNVGVPRSAELHEYIATTADTWVFGHLGAHDEEDGTVAVTFSCRILGDFVYREELEQAVVWVTRAADEIDDLIHDRFGGTRAVDGPGSNSRTDACGPMAQSA